MPNAKHQMDLLPSPGTLAPERQSIQSYVLLQKKTTSTLPTGKPTKNSCTRRGDEFVRSSEAPPVADWLPRARGASVDPPRLGTPRSSIMQEPRRTIDFSQLNLEDVILEESSVEKDESVDLNEPEQLPPLTRTSLRASLWRCKEDQVQEEPKPSFCAGEEIEVKCVDGNWYRAYLRTFNGESEECNITFLGEEHTVHPDLMIRSVEDCCSDSNYQYFSGSDSESSSESDNESDPGQTRRSTAARTRSKTLSERMRSHSL